MSHQQTMTVEVDRKFWNIRSVINGRKVSDAEAIQHAVDTGENLGQFDTLAEAVRAAKSRSESFDGAEPSRAPGSLSLHPRRAAAASTLPSGLSLNPRAQQLREQPAPGAQPPPAPVRARPEAAISALPQPSLLERAKEAIFGGVRTGETALGRLIPESLATRLGIGGRIEANLTPEQAAATRPFVRAEAFRTTPGLVRGGLEELSGFTTPENIALILGTGAFGRILSNPASRMIVQRLIAAGFGADLLISTAQQAPEFVEAIERGDETAAREIAGRLAVRGTAGAGALRFGVGGRRAGLSEKRTGERAALSPSVDSATVVIPREKGARGPEAAPQEIVAPALREPLPRPLPRRPGETPAEAKARQTEALIDRAPATGERFADSAGREWRVEEIAVDSTGERPAARVRLSQVNEPTLGQEVRLEELEQRFRPLGEERPAPKPAPEKPPVRPEFRPTTPEQQLLTLERENADLAKRLPAAKTTEERAQVEARIEENNRLMEELRPGRKEVRPLPEGVTEEAVEGEVAKMRSRGLTAGMSQGEIRQTAIETLQRQLARERARPAEPPAEVLPGMEQAVREQAEGARRVEAERLTDEFARPAGEVAPEGVDIARSPLFRGTEAAPQREIFAAERRRPTEEVRAPREPRLLPKDVQVFDRHGDRLRPGENATDPRGKRVKVEGFLEMPGGELRAIVKRGKVREQLAVESLSVRSAPRRGVPFAAPAGVRQFGESDIAHAERLMGPGGVLGPTGGTLYANPVFSPRFWESADAALSPLTKRIDHAINTAIGKLPVSVRRLLREEPRTKQILQEARREVGQRRNETEGVLRMVLRENPTPDELAVADRIARGVPGELSPTRPELRAPIREAAERVHQLAQQMTAERAALGLPVRQEWVEGPKHWYPNLWKQHVFSPRMVMGRLFAALRPGRALGPPTAAERGSLKPRTTDRWAVVDAKGDIARTKTGQQAIFDSAEAARGFVASAGEKPLRILQPMTHEQAVAHGLIEDLTLNIRYGFGKNWSLLAKTRALDRIGRELAVDVPQEGFVNLPSMGFEIPAELAKRNPNIARLRDGYVPEEVAETLTAYYGRRGVWDTRFRLLEGTLRKWVTVYSPFRHPRNLVENHIALAFGDPKAALNFPAMQSAFRDFARGARGERGVPFWEEYASSRLVNTDILRGEFETVWRGLERVEPGAAPLSLTERMALWAEGNPAARKLLRTRDFMQRAYRAEDQVWKYYEYRTLRERGLLPEAAEARTRRTFFDYEDVPPIIRAVNRVVPFIFNVSFQYARIFATALRDRPASSTMKIALLLYGYAFMRDELLKRAGITEQDEKNMGRLGLRPWEFPLPMTDDKGRNLVVNLQWAVPFSEIELLRFAALEEDPERGFVQVARRFLPMAAQPVATAVSQRGAFGERILRGTESREVAAKKLARAVALGFLPGLLGQYWDRLYRNVTAGEEKRESLPVAALVKPTVGRIERIRPEERVGLRKALLAGKQRKLSEDAGRQRGLLLRGSISASRFREEIATLRRRTAEEDVAHPETLAVVQAIEQNRNAQAQAAFGKLVESGFYADKEEAREAVRGLFNLRERFREFESSPLPEARAAAEDVVDEIRRSGRPSPAIRRRFEALLARLSESDQEALLEWLEEQVRSARKAQSRRRGVPFVSRPGPQAEARL